MEEFDEISATDHLKQHRRKRKHVLYYWLLVAVIALFITAWMFILLRPAFDHSIPHETFDRCVCKWNHSLYNFCYKQPHGNHARGMRFSCSFVPILAELNLLETPYTWHGNASEYPTIVTAISADYFKRGLNMLSTAVSLLYETSVVVYDLGLTSEQIAKLKLICRVVVERFPFERYPKYVRNLSHFRWKPLVIADALRKYGPIVYADSSVFFISNTFRHMSSLCYYRALASEECRISPYLLHSDTGHSIPLATMSSVTDFIPMNRTAAKDVNMFEAGLAHISPDPEITDILKWFVLCALQEWCMVPHHTHPIHECRNELGEQGPVCHRFDQSVINVLLFNAYNGNSKNYTSGNPSFFYIRRNMNQEIEDDLFNGCARPMPE